MLVLLSNSLLLFSQHCHIGDVITNPDGSKGVAFYINPEGTGGWMVALNDVSSGCPWGELNDDIPGLPNNELNTPSLQNEINGKENTRIIREHQNNSSTYAAGKVDFNHGWYLPAAIQLRMLYSTMSLIESSLVANGGSILSNNRYWSSTEVNKSSAIVIDPAYNPTGSTGSTTLSNGGKYASMNKTQSYAVRAIADFSVFQWDTESIADSIQVSPSVTTTYTVTLTEGGMCPFTESITIMVNHPEYDSFEETACESYTWHGTTYTELGTHTYTYETLTEEGCEKIETLNLTITGLPEVTITTSTGDETICEGEEITLYALVQQASVGDILCTDGTFVHPADWSASNGKTAKGVIFYVDGSGSHGWALGLNDLGTAKWCAAETTVPGLTYITSSRQAILDIDGASNTQKIRAAGNATQYPAVWLITEQMYNDGWYLPAMGQMRYMYANFYTINYALQKVGGVALLDTESWFYWTSTQHSAQKKWELGYRGDVTSYNGTTSTPRVRAVCSF